MLSSERNKDKQGAAVNGLAVLFLYTGKRIKIMIITTVGIMTFMFVRWVGILKEELYHECKALYVLGFAYNAKRSRHDVTYKLVCQKYEV